MFCPECGSEAGEAKFCPECGNDLGVVRKVMGKGTPPRTGAVAGKGKSAGASGRSTQQPAAQRPTGKRNLTAVYLWGVIAVVAIVVAIVVWQASGGKNAAVGTLAPPDAGTAGTYDELVKRANDQLDSGYQLLQQSKDPAFSADAVPYFQAADKVYAAAWKKQSNDPNVATDWSYTIFYSGDTQRAITKTQEIVARWPDFQPAYHHRGLFLWMAAMNAFGKQGGTAEGQKLAAEAKSALEKAVSLDPNSEFGKEAKGWLQGLTSSLASASAVPAK